MGRTKPLTKTFLRSKRVPEVFIAGLILASTLGWAGWNSFSKSPSYYSMKQLFPDTTQVMQVIDGDTVEVANDMTVRMVGIDAPAKGKSGYQEATDFLTSLVASQSVTLEYDAYQDDKYGRILAYIWIPCIQELATYCRAEHKGEILVNEVMVKEGKASHVVYSKRKRLRYEEYFILR
jgi:endonuclease YncB( thermonuclease family)